MTSFIWDRRSGKQIAWIENDHDVYSVVTKRKFATVRDGKLYSLSGEFLNRKDRELAAIVNGKVMAKRFYQ
jgi:hypothetical protein